MEPFDMDRRKPMTMTKTKTKNPQSSVRIEGLEPRRLLSAAAPQTVHPMLAPAAIGAPDNGYSPAQIKHAYGFDQVSANGAGQTIAIVDAFNDPNIANDLSVFSQNFGLPAANLKVVSQTGGSVSNIKTDTGWAGEIALDVEWAHGAAPGANILLVEAKSDSITDLMAAVDYARKAQNVSVVSMSWGGSEFRGQTQFDKYFTTPAGHQNVTFIASSGDSGSWFGPSWPATSPSVLSVGGTSLYTSDNAGTYAAESGWRYSGGGISSVYPVPSYQASAQSTGSRTSPDVAYNADPYTGFAVYDSIADQGYVGWQVIGGTSAGAPQWAALIAIADQVRNNSGKGTLDGASNTLPALYKLYSPPGSASYASYTADFDDVVGGRSSRFLAAHSGYDGVTGLGSPKVAAIVSALSGVPGVTVTVGFVRAARAVRSNTRRFPVTTGSDGSSGSTTTTTITAVNPVNGTILDLRPLTVATLDPGTRDMLENSTSSAAIISRFTGNVAANQSAPSSASRLVQDIASAAALPQTAIAAVVITDLAIPAATVPAIVRIASTDAVTAFSDAMASFAQESAALGDMVGAVLGGASDAGAASHAITHGRAWAATIAVLAADAVLIGTWQAHRRAQKQRAKRRAPYQRTFSLLPIER
jgi:hypothetical protein